MVISKLENGQDAVVSFKNGDIKSFADALVKWMQNPSILREGRVNAYKEIHKYTKAPIMKKWIFLFQKILKE